MPPPMVFGNFFFLFFYPTLPRPLECLIKKTYALCRGKKWGKRVRGGHTDVQLVLPSLPDDKNARLLLYHSTWVIGFLWTALSFWFFPSRLKTIGLVSFTGSPVFVSYVHVLKPKSAFGIWRFHFKFHNNYRYVRFIPSRHCWRENNSICIY